jgi:hypothetical protein
MVVGFTHTLMLSNSLRVQGGMIFNTTSNNIPVISCISVLLVKETGVPSENHRLVASHWQTLSHNDVSSALRHFASIFFAYLWSFRWPNYIVTLPRYFSFRLPHLNIPTGLRWIFHMHSEFSRPAMCNNATWSSPLNCKVSL